MIGKLVTAISGVASSAIQARTEKTQAKHKLELAVLENKARLAAAEHAANSSWEMAQLEDKDKWLRGFRIQCYRACSHNCCQPNGAGQFLKT